MVASGSGMPIEAICRKLRGVAEHGAAGAGGIGSTTVSAAGDGSVADAFTPAIRELLAQGHDIPATVIADRVGWPHSVTLLRRRVRQVRPMFVPLDLVSRTTYQPGELVQCDLWIPPVKVSLGAGQVGTPPALVMVSGYSRVMTAVVIPTRQAPDLIAGHWALLTGWRATPKALVGDNESAVGSWRRAIPS